MEKKLNPQQMENKINQLIKKYEEDITYYESLLTKDFHPQKLTEIRHDISSYKTFIAQLKEIINGKETI